MPLLEPDGEVFPILKLMVLSVARAILGFLNWRRRSSLPEADAGSKQFPSNAVRDRLLLANAHLEWLDAEQERRGDSSFGKASADRVVWVELLDLELQDVDEQVNRICDTACDVDGAEHQSGDVSRS